MDALKAAFAEIRQVRDTEGVHSLLLDCWLVAVEKGEAEGLKWAAMLKRSIEEYVRHERATQVFGKWKREGDL